MTRILVATLLATFAAPSFAQAHHIDFTATLTGLDGKSLSNGDSKAPHPVTLSEVAVNALDTPLDGDRELRGEAKFALDQLARKVYQAKDVVLTAEEVATLKDRIGKAYGPLVVGAAWRMIDPATGANAEK